MCDWNKVKYDKGSCEVRCEVKNFVLHIENISFGRCRMYMSNLLKIYTFVHTSVIGKVIEALEEIHGKTVMGG